MPKYLLQSCRNFWNYYEDSIVFQFCSLAELMLTADVNNSICYFEKCTWSGKMSIITYCVLSVTVLINLNSYYCVIMTEFFDEDDKTFLRVFMNKNLCIIIYHLFSFYGKGARFGEEFQERYS